MNMDADFFVGWAPRAPRRLAAFIAAVVGASLIGLVALAMTLGRATDVGAGDILGEANLTGVLQSTPYPLLRAPPDAAHPMGHAVMLAGEGKYGLGARGDELAGQRIEARGALVKRGDLDMLIVSPEDGLTQATPATGSVAPTIPLGRWRVNGEICDGKCNAGVMRPGKGIAHRACASLCVAGGVPAVFVSTAPLDGATFLLLADANGGPPPSSMLDLIALPVTLEGDVERRDDLLVFRVDWTRARAR
jgi:hypothetical protein